MSRNLLLSYLLQTAHRGDGVADAELLRRFAAERDEAAFELLVRRHADAVWKACRGVAGQHADAEDAFQATFLALARRAGAVRGSAAGWLHRVAVRAALKVRAKAGRAGLPLTSDVPAPANDRTDAAAVHEEVARLPDRYRLPVVLCDLEGRTHAEAAAELGWPVGTVSVRLSRARNQLRGRLERRGVAGAVALTAGGSAPAALIRTTAAVGAAPSAAVASLTTGVLIAMQTAKLKWAAVAAVGMIGLAGGGTLWAVGAGDAPKPAAKAPDPPPKAAAKPAPPDLKGTWVTTVTTTGTIDGKEQPPRTWEQRTIITADRIIELDEDGFIQMESKYVLGSTGAADTINFTDPRRGLFEGVYRRTGDRLRVVYTYFGLGKTLNIDTAAPDSGWDLTRVAGVPAVLPVQRYPNDDGWFWILPPEYQPASKATSDGVAFNYDKDADGAAVVTLATGTGFGVLARGRPDYRIVLYDANKTRYLPAAAGSVSAGSQRDQAVVTLARWRMDPTVLPADKVKLIGIEQSLKADPAK